MYVHPSPHPVHFTGIHTASPITHPCFRTRTAETRPRCFRSRRFLVRRGFKPRQLWKSVPASLVARLQYYNVAVESEPGAKFNPWRLLAEVRQDTYGTAPPSHSLWARV